jgi:hypothetical protein
MKRHSDVCEITLFEGKENAMITLIVRQVTTMDVDCYWTVCEYLLTYVPGAAYQERYSKPRDPGQLVA